MLAVLRVATPVAVRFSVLIFFEKIFSITAVVALRIFVMTSSNTPLTAVIISENRFVIVPV